VMNTEPMRHTSMRNLSTASPLVTDSGATWLSVSQFLLGRVVDALGTQ
jgi:flagellar biosynthesis/type III secretory pathway ATPase